MIGETIAHYKIIEKLGEGGMGVVYKAEDTKLKREVAIKFLPSQVASDDTARSRFMVEAQAAAALNHPNIATIYAIEEVDDKLFIVMEYVKGQTLRKKLETDPFTVSETFDFAKQVSEGLHEAHKRGVVHRDIKTSNIMLTESGQAKIMDFGLAKLSESSLITKEGSTLGTAAYMSPEQAKGDKVDHRTDIWSFGIVLYEMLCGCRPFRGEYEQAMLYSVINTDPEPASEKMPESPDGIDTLFEKLFMKNPEERIRTFRDVIADLDKLQEGTSISAAPAKSKAAPGSDTGKAKTIISDTTVITLTPKKKKILMALAPALSILIIVISYFLFIKNDDTIDSLAILPFVNVSGDENTEYLSEGIPESIISSLQKIPGLKVTSFNAVLNRYKKDTPLASDVRDDFDVDAVVMGRITMRGDDISVSIEIVDTRDNNVLAAEQYVERLSSLVNIQPKIARGITEELSLQLTPEDERKVYTLLSENSEAYDRYILGRHHWRKRSRDGFTNAIEHFQEAIKIDPEYALAYSGLADCFVLNDIYSLEITDYLNKAKDAAEKAVEYGPGLAESHTSLGYVYYWDSKFEKGREEFETAIDLNPDYAT
ncbi:MAG: protein kinase, partial [Planctomycetes bacterium]|nr:protein kinase [Planctomycetota bacterium]